MHGVEAGNIASKDDHSFGFLAGTLDDLGGETFLLPLLSNRIFSRLTSLCKVWLNGLPF